MVRVVMDDVGTPQIVSLPHPRAGMSREQLGQPEVVGRTLFGRERALNDEAKQVDQFRKHSDATIQDLCRSLTRLDASAPEIIRLCRLFEQ